MRDVEATMEIKNGIINRYVPNTSVDDTMCFLTASFPIVVESS